MGKRADENWEVVTTQLTIQVTYVISGTILGVDMVHGEAKGVGCWRRMPSASEMSRVSSLGS